MSRTLVIICSFMCVSLSAAQWCVKNSTIEIPVKKIGVKTRKIGGNFFIKGRVIEETYSYIGSTVTTKDIRVCCGGYDHDVENNVCKPICHNECINGFCAGPNKCECNSEYQMNAENTKCEPICHDTCGEHAFCSAPGVCSCKYGFTNDTSGLCQPWCKTECVNGECIGPNNCACHQGFVKIGGLCLLDCHDSCAYGDCIESVCQCWSDYKFNVVTMSCEEAPHTITNCTDNTICNEDYYQLTYSTEPSSTSSSSTSSLSTSSSSSSSSSTLSSSTDLIERNCEKGCWAGTCIEGICQCSEGLVLNHENDCIMPCEATCLNGVCNQENTCECPRGYSHNKTVGCVSQCKDGCTNGFCVAPNTCQCYEGYDRERGDLTPNKCLPTCDGVVGDDGCINGTCISVNKCQCFDGFFINPGNRFECIPMYKSVEQRETKFWYVYLPSIILILLILCLLGLFLIQRLHHNSYNVEEVEAQRGMVQFTRCEQRQYCFA